MPSLETNPEAGMPAPLSEKGFCQSESGSHRAACIASALPIPTLIVDFEGRIVRVNRATAEFLGCAEADVEGRLYGEFFPPEERAERVGELQRLVRGGGSASYEGQFVCSDGSLRWLGWISVVMRAEKLIYSVARDITEQRRTQEDARASREWLVFTLDAAGVGLTYSEDGETRATDWQFRLYGLDPEPRWISEERWRSLIHPVDREAVETARRSAAQAGQPHDVQFRVIWPDGSLHWLQCRGAALHSGGATRNLEVTVDVTERKRAETALEKFFAFSSRPTTIVGFDGSVKYANRAALQSVGLAAEEARGLPLLGFVHPEDRLALRQEMEKLIAGGGEMELECRTLKKDGVRWSSVSAMALPDEQSIIVVSHDITARRLAETARLDAERLFRALAENSRTGIYVIREDKIAYVNRALCSGAGYSCEELIGADPLQFIDPRDRPAIGDAIRRRLSGEPQSTSYEFRTRRKDGAVHYIEVFAAPVEIEGRPAVIGNLLDITGRKRAEEELREAQRKFAAAFRSSPCATTLADLDDSYRYMDASDSHESVTGYRREEIIGRTALELAAFADPVEFATIQERLLSEGNVRDFEFRFRRKDGQVRRGLVSADLILLKGRKCVISATRDITGRKESEAVLAKEMFRRRLAFERNRDGIVVVDGEGRIREVNQSYSGMIGYGVEELIGMHIWEIGEQFTAESVAEVVRTVREGAAVPALLDVRHRRKDGAVIDVEVSPTHYEIEGEIFFYCTIRDITERKRAHQALLQSQEELAIYAGKLARSNAELERFAYVASHDLQEPLRMVAGFTRLLAKRYSGRLDETANRYIDYAEDGAKRMQHLIADLLAYSRVNCKDLDLRPVALEPLVRGAMRNLQAAIEESGASITVEALPSLPVEQMHFTQLFQNLVGNALKFRRPGVRPEVRISAVDNGAEYVLSVADNGIGICPEYRERVFQIFQRLHSRAEYAGTGIGLAICKKVVERHGGRIWVEAGAGHGSIFRFTLPRP
jgi:PAS domain S-box-containing protein